MIDGLLPTVPLEEDVTVFHVPPPIAATSSGVVGGFPCQEPCSDFKVMLLKYVFFND